MSFYQIYLFSILPISVWAESNYEPPLGIPQPSFGIKESHTIYEGQLFDYNKDGKSEAPYKDVGNGPYTHYINKSSSSATDWRNPYGTPQKPRLTIPSRLSPGSVVEIHGSGYKWTVSSKPVKGKSGLAGTREKPIFIRGYSSTKNDRPVFTHWGDNILGASYTIIENLDWDFSSMGKENFEINQPSHHLGIRNCSFRDAPADYGRSVVAHWPSSAWKDGEWIEDIVWYQCEWINNGEFPSTFESGIHGMQISQACRRIWILGCNFEKNSEDGIHIIRVGPLFPKGRGNDYANHIYVGNCSFFKDGENAIDVKQSHDVIISSNHIWGYKDSDASDGSAVVFNNDEPNDNLWLINNCIHDSTIGIRTQSSGDVYMVGNVFFNIRHEPSSNSPGYHTGVGILASTFTAFHAVNNTFFKCDGGITVRNGKRCVIQNNIFAERKEATNYDLWLNRTPLSKYTVSHNLYWPRKRMKGKGFLETESLTIDPLFEGPWTEFVLADRSPARDSGMKSDVYTTFQSSYNLSIKQDLWGGDRPIDGWDRGATEFSTSHPEPSQK